MNNSEPGNYNAAYSVLVQLVTEVRADDVPVDVIRAMLNMQVSHSTKVLVLGSLLNRLVSYTVLVKN